MFPEQIKILKKSNLIINWNDGGSSIIDLKTMRKNCPCATCLAEKEMQSRTYIPIFTADQLNVESINPVGNYAISVIWKDGHNTGIYEFSYLKTLENL